MTSSTHNLYALQTWLNLKDAVLVHLNPFGQNDENNCLACIAWQTWLTGKNAVPVRLNPIGQHDENNCLACVA